MEEPTYSLSCSIHCKTQWKPKGNKEFFRDSGNIIGILCSQNHIVKTIDFSFQKTTVPLVRLTCYWSLLRMLLSTKCWEMKGTKESNKNHNVGFPLLSSKFVLYQQVWPLEDFFLGTTHSGAHRGEDVLTLALKICEPGFVQLKKQLQWSC